MVLRIKAFEYSSLLMLLIALPLTMTIEGPLILSTNSETRESKMNRYRLPTNTIPDDYHVYMEPIMDQEILTWIGDVSIKVEVIERTSTLTLHAYNSLDIIESFTDLYDTAGSTIIPISHYRDRSLDLLKILFGRDILPGNYTLNIRFQGRPSICCWAGFFKQQTGDNRTIAVTSFEPAAARRVFPCWDEPGFKAHFRVTIKHTSNYTVVSNMGNGIRHRTVDGMILTDFLPTPPLSTYLLNIVITDYQTMHSEDGNATIVTRLPYEDVNYFLDLSSKVVDVMQSYTGVSFGFPRIGSVLIPYYPLNGTGQSGLVSYNEDAVNGNKSLLTTAQNESAYLLIAHELTHSWFGNRVTPLWWNDLWINEAFAAYFPYYIMDQIDANWGGEELFVLSNNHEGAFPRDTDDKIPITYTPITKREILRQFKKSSCQKGAAIIHMFRHILGDDVFRTGIQKFMIRNSFKSVVTDDLTTALQDAYNAANNNKDKPLDLKVAIAPWLEQKGYPIIKVTRNYSTGESEVAQRNTANDEKPINWWIPLTFATKSEPNFSTTIPTDWISEKTKTVRIEKMNNDDWLIVNVQASGYYRVNYDDENWNKLADYLDTDNYGDIHVLNRAQLISDAFYLAEREPDWYFHNFWNIIRYLAREKEYLPWRAAYYALTRIAESLPRSSVAHTLFQNYVVDLMERFIRKVGFEPRENDDHYTKLARTDVIKWACINGHSRCTKYAAQKIRELAEDPVKNQLQPDMKSWAFCAGLKGLNNDEAMYVFLWAYQNTKDLFIESIGCTENHNIHKYLLGVSLTKNEIGDPYETTDILKSLLASTQENHNYAIDFFIEHHGAFNHSIVQNNWYEISDILNGIAENVQTKEELKKFNEIFQLEVIRQDPKISQEAMTKAAEKNIAKTDDCTKRFLKWWDKQLSTENSIHNHMFTRDSED